MRNLNKHQLPSHVYIPLLLKVVLYSVNESSDTERRMTVFTRLPLHKRAIGPVDPQEKRGFLRHLLKSFLLCAFIVKSNFASTF